MGIFCSVETGVNSSQQVRVCGELEYEMRKRREMGWERKNHNMRSLSLVGVQIRLGSAGNGYVAFLLI